MTPKSFAASLIALALAAPAVTAQSDKLLLVTGETLSDVSVTSWEIRNLTYKKDGRSQTLSNDQVAKITHGKFKDVFARGLNDPDVMLTLAREQQSAKNDVLAQLGMVAAANKFFDFGKDSEAVAALDELQKSYPAGGAIPFFYRLKFEYYMGVGKNGIASAVAIAKKYETDVISNAWPQGFAVEATFFRALAEQADIATYQRSLRGVVDSARGLNPIIANRANVELAHSLRNDKKEDEAKRIYESIIKSNGVDDSSLAGAYLGLGYVQMAQAGNDKEQLKQALLNFLRVRLETTESWPGQQAEALYQAMQAAAKWQGPEYRLVYARCRAGLLGDYPNSEWAAQAK